MIDNYDDIMNEWANPHQGCCSGTMTIAPDVDLKRWAVQQTVTILANSDYYYTKDEVNHLIDMVTASGVTSGQVEEMIAVAIADKADKSEVNAIAEQVRQNTEDILNTYTKQETNALLTAFYSKLQTDSMFAGYSRVEGSTLVLNANNIGITI